VKKYSRRAGEQEAAWQEGWKKRRSFAVREKVDWREGRK